LIGSFRSYHTQIKSLLPQDMSCFQGNRNTSATSLARYSPSPELTCGLISYPRYFLRLLCLGELERSEKQKREQPKLSTFGQD